MKRRTFISGAGAAGAILMSRPGGVLAGSLAGGTRAQVADRASRLFPGSFLVHADMHNHTLFSDGDGDPANAFVSMRDNGLDVAALTDHAVLGGVLSLPMEICGSACKSVQGMNDANWADTRRYADEAYEPDTFVAIRGFEWSSPTLGHMNVWFSQDWIDPERTGGLVGIEGLELITDQIPFVDEYVGPHLANLVSDTPIAGIAMRPFYNWLNSAPGSGLFGGGRDGIVGFNHPGREPGRFGAFLYDDALVDRSGHLQHRHRQGHRMDRQAATSPASAARNPHADRDPRGGLRRSCAERASRVGHPRHRPRRRRLGRAAGHRPRGGIGWACVGRLRRRRTGDRLRQPLLSVRGRVRRRGHRPGGHAFAGAGCGD